MIDPDRLTVKAQQAVNQAQVLAKTLDHQEIDTGHLLLALVGEREGLTMPLLRRLGVNVNTLEDRLRARPGGMPGVLGAQRQYVSDRLNRVLDSAWATAQAMKDEYVSVEHILLAIAESSGPAADVLREFGATPDDILRALADIRGSTRSTGRGPSSA